MKMFFFGYYTTGITFSQTKIKNHIEYINLKGDRINSYNIVTDQVSYKHPDLYPSSMECYDYSCMFLWYSSTKNFDTDIIHYKLFNETHIGETNNMTISLNYSPSSSTTTGATPYSKGVHKCFI